jgi:hypothetical protein
LFQRNDPAKLLLGADGEDVLRNGEGTAIIGDPRNDSHVLMSADAPRVRPCPQPVR